MNETEERTGVAHSVKEHGIDDEEPPGKPRRHPLWRNVPDKLWDDWRWQSQNAIRSVRQLRDLLPFSPEELEAIGALEAEYKLAIPPYYFSLIDPDDPNDPIRLQSVTSPLEANSSALNWKIRSKRTRIRPCRASRIAIPTAALLVTTHVCTMYCRFCTRKRATMVRGGWDAISRDDERMIEYVRDHPEIRDVIVSGGDPLTLPLRQAASFSSKTCATSRTSMSSASARACRPPCRRSFTTRSCSTSWQRRRRCGSRRTSTIRAKSRRRRPACAGPAAGRHAAQQPCRPAEGGQRRPGDHAAS